ncbi:MAG: BrnA antitoxin family protein [Acetobacteraceae bacterium]
MKNEDITRKFSAAELRERKRSQSRIDVARLRRMTEAELEESIRRDPDWNRVPKDWHLKAQAMMPVRKRLVSVRLDEDVIDWFKGQGAGYQTRMNAVPRSFMNEEKTRRAG